MKNREISVIFGNIGKLMQIRGDASFRINSYLKAADTIEDLNDDVSELIEKGTFQNFSGIGKTIEAKTREILETGTCAAYEKLVAEIGTDALDILKIQGIGSKTASRLYNELGIKNLTHLTEALEDGRLQQMKGLGQKTLQTIRTSLQFQISQQATRLLVRAVDIAENLSNIFNRCDDITQHEFSGDVRRKEEMCRSLEVVVECLVDARTTHDALIELLATHVEQLHAQFIDTQDAPKRTRYCNRYKKSIFSLTTIFLSLSTCVQALNTRQRCS